MAEECTHRAYIDELNEDQKSAYRAGAVQRMRNRRLMPITLSISVIVGIVAVWVMMRFTL